MWREHRFGLASLAKFIKQAKMNWLHFKLKWDWLNCITYGDQNARNQTACHSAFAERFLTF